MSHHQATIQWQRKADEIYTDQKYSRAHEWHFDGGAVIQASSSPDVVPIYSNPANVDPEEAFVASLSSCHMLFFLSIAAKKKLVVEQYNDTANGVMQADANGIVWMSQVILNPKVIFSDTTPVNREQLEKIHHLAHQQCFIANSVKTQVITKIAE